MQIDILFLQELFFLQIQVSLCGAVSNCIVYNLGSQVWACGPGLAQKWLAKIQGTQNFNEKVNCNLILAATLMQSKVSRKKVAL